jgi:hypothetical protein
MLLYALRVGIDFKTNNRVFGKTISVGIGGIEDLKDNMVINKGIIALNEKKRSF